jgi:hypothetical protein
MHHHLSYFKGRSGYSYLWSHHISFILLFKKQRTVNRKGRGRLANISLRVTSRFTVAALRGKGPSLHYIPYIHMCMYICICSIMHAYTYMYSCTYIMGISPWFPIPGFRQQQKTVVKEYMVLCGSSGLLCFTFTILFLQRGNP